MEEKFLLWCTPVGVTRSIMSKSGASRKRRSTITGLHPISSQCIEDDIPETIAEEGESDLSTSTIEQNLNHMVVAVRIRPLSKEEQAAGKRSCCRVTNGCTVEITKGATHGAYLRSQQGQMNEYMFDAAFDSKASQADVYKGSAKPFIGDVLEGLNVTIFAYGATGAGKTHTMMGSERVVGTKREELASGGSTEEVSGIVPQSLVDVFKGIERKYKAAKGREEEWKVKVGYLEVYNDQIFDLLEPCPGKALRIYEDPTKGIVTVAGLAEREVKTSDEVLVLLRQGNAHRKTEATMANQVSSRSHAVLQVTITRSFIDNGGNDVVRESKLSLIDLAGSERASATNNSGALLRQGASINKSLLALASCINALAANADRAAKGGTGAAGNVKYRDSKLTHLLKSSLEGRCRLVMIANINPSHSTYDDSHNTLKYANRAKNIKVAPRATEETREATWQQREERLTRENAALRQANESLRVNVERLMQRKTRGSSVEAPVTWSPEKTAERDDPDGHHNDVSSDSSSSSKQHCKRQRRTSSRLSTPGGGGSSSHSNEQEETAQLAALSRQVQELQHALSVTRALNDDYRQMNEEWRLRKEDAEASAAALLEENEQLKAQLAHMQQSAEGGASHTNTSNTLGGASTSTASARVSPNAAPAPALFGLTSAGDTHTTHTGGDVMHGDVMHIGAGLVPAGNDENASAAAVRSAAPARRTRRSSMIPRPKRPLEEETPLRRFGSELTNSNPPDDDQPPSKRRFSIVTRAMAATSIQ